jgi:hypothetical protein
VSENSRLFAGDDGKAVALALTSKPSSASSTPPGADISSFSFGRGGPIYPIELDRRIKAVTRPDG